MSISDFKIIDPHACDLNKAKIDLWFLSLEKVLPAIESFLSPDELERSNRFHFEKHKRRFCNARGMLRLILSRYLNCDAKSIDFIYNKHGKPSIKHPQDIQFNVSHSGEWALIGIGKNHPIGVDLECYSSRPYEGIASHLFSPAEQNMVQNSLSLEKPWLFFNIWAQKEAFIKACGLGLFYPTQEFTVSLRQSNDQTIFDNKHQTHWQMKSFMPRAALSAALCHHPDINQINYLALKDNLELFD